ncbi:hypothetical protein [Roseimaritima ulvae]|nr:hypothetical protein [Roseimaritima ulvae]
MTYVLRDGHVNVIRYNGHDGSTRTLAETVDSQVFVDLCRMQDGNAIADY